MGAQTRNKLSLLIKFIQTSEMKRLFKKIKEDVDGHFLRNVTKAVITLPAYFNHHQRKESLEAAKQAGFTVLKFVNEPNAAVLNSDYEHGLYSKHLLVYDLGGGTFDVSVIKRTENGVVELLAIDGDSNLGGSDFDELILAFVENKLKKNHTIQINKCNSMQLKTKCEAAKRKLSHYDNTEIILQNIQGHDRVSVPLSRKQFDEMTHSRLTETLNITKRCIEKSKINFEDIGQVILVGGSTRIPKVHDMVSSLFRKAFIKKNLYPVECIAFGAALQAAMLSTHPIQNFEDPSRIIEVVPLSIGQMSIGGSMDVFIQKNTRIPVSVTKRFCNFEHNQINMIFHIYEGERSDCQKNIALGKVDMNLTPALPGTCIVFLTIRIDSAGILTCTAKEELSGTRKDVTIDSYTRGIRSDSEVKEIIKDAEINKTSDKLNQVFCDRSGYLRSYCAAITYNIIAKNLDVPHKDLLDKCRDLSQKFYKNLISFDIKRLDNKIREVTNLGDQLAKDYNFDNMPLPLRK